MEVEADRINNTMGKIALHLQNHNNIVVSVSGGSDSDIIVHILATYFREFLYKIRFIFINTGLEYQATKNHIKYIEQRYNINIEEIKGMPIPYVVKKYGVPIISKEHSQRIIGFINGSESATKRVTGDYSVKKYCFSKKQKELAFAIKERNIKVSDICCKKSKKEPYYKYMKCINADLSITGERKCEGGTRATSHSSCFEANTAHGYDKFMPLFFWNDATKQYYKESEGIIYSDCYEIWGLKRTGCVGCPFNSKIYEELNTIKKYEPKMYKACIGTFGTSYRLMDEFDIRKEKILKDV